MHSEFIRTITQNTGIFGAVYWTLVYAGGNQSRADRDSQVVCGRESGVESKGVRQGARGYDYEPGYF